MRATWFLSIGKNQRRFLMVMLVTFLSLGTCGAAFAESSWFGLRDEPELISVAGTLHDTSTIVVRTIIDGQDTTLTGHTARAFLYLRSYIIFDDDAARWRTTDKYKAWKDRLVNSPPQSQGTYVGNGVTFVSGQTPGGARFAVCYSSDGRNRTCQNNGCVAPPGYGKMYCYWRIEDFNGNIFKILGTTGQRIP